MSQKTKKLLYNLEIICCIGLLILSLGMMAPDWNYQPKCKDLMWFVLAELATVELYNIVKENKSKQNGKA